MSAPKSRKNRRKHEHQQTRFDDLQRKLEQGPFAHQEIVIEPENAAKMSDMLEDFVEPYRDTADTKDAYQKLLTLGMMAWNAALLPAKEQQNMLQQLLDRLPHTSAEDKKVLTVFLRELIERKLKYFSQNRRAILSIDLQDTGDGYYLSVASTLEKKSL